MNGPIRRVQFLNFLEVAVPGNKDHPVTFRRGGDPEVVLGKGPPFLLQILLYPPVLPACTRHGFFAQIQDGEIRGIRWRISETLH